MSRRSPIKQHYLAEFHGSTILSAEKDLQEVLRLLFIDNPYADELKRLLVIQNKDCISDRTNPEYAKIVKEYSVDRLFKEGYLTLMPKLFFGENAPVRSIVRFSITSILPNPQNDYFKNTVFMVDILCHPEKWDLGDCQLRPLKIAGYIDGVLNNAKITGLGTANFAGLSTLHFSEELSGYCMQYTFIHGNDDKIDEEYTDISN